MTDDEATLVAPSGESGARHVAFVFHVLIVAMTKAELDLVDAFEWLHQPALHGVVGLRHLDVDRVFAFGRVAGLRGAAVEDP